MATALDNEVGFVPENHADTFGFVPDSDVGFVPDAHDVGFVADEPIRAQNLADSSLPRMEDPSMQRVRPTEENQRASDLESLWYRARNSAIGQKLLGRNAEADAALLSQSGVSPADKIPNRLEQGGLIPAAITPFQGTIPRAGQAKTTAGKVASGVGNAAAGLAEGIASPIAPLTEAPVLGRAVSAAFAADMLGHAPGQVKQAFESAQAGDLQGAVESSVSAAASVGLGGLSAVHAAAGTAVAGIRKAAGEKASEVAPEVPKASVETPPPPEPTTVAPPPEPLPQSSGTPTSEVAPEPPISATTGGEGVTSPEPASGAAPPEIPPPATPDYPVDPEAIRQTAIKDAVVDKERVDRGEQPLMVPERRTDAQVLAEAAAIEASDPQAAEKLTQIATEGSRPLFDQEFAVLLRERVRINNELTKAVDSGDQEQIDFWRSKKDANDVAVSGPGKSGTVAGRALGFRSRVMNDDFTLASLDRDFRAQSGRSPDASELADLKKTAEEHAALTAKVAELESKAQETSREAAMRVADAEARSSAPKIHPEILSKAEGLVRKLETAADAAWERVKAKLSQAGAIPDPTIFGDLAIIGSAKIARGLVEFGRWSKAMADQVGDWMTPEDLKAVYDASQKRFEEDVKGVKPEVRKAAQKPDAYAKIDQAAQEIGLRMASGERDAMVAQVQKLHRALIEADPNMPREAVVDWIHEVLKKHDPEITRQDTMDAISGRGRFTIPRQDEVSKTVRDQKQQLRLIGHQIDVEAGRPLPRTGPQRDKMSDAARREQQVLNELMRKNGVTSTDPATQLAGALQARKTYYTHRMADLRAEIAARERIVKTKTPSPTDHELESMIVEYADVKAQHDAIFPKDRTLTDAQRLEIATKAAEKSATMWEQRLAEAKKGNLWTGSKAEVRPTSAKLEAIQARRDAARDAAQELKDLANPKKTPEERRLSALKARVSAKTARLEEQMAIGDFSAKPKLPPVKPDAELLAAQAKLAKIENGVYAKRAAAEDAQRTKVEKVGDFISRWYRAGILSGPQTLAKLTAAATWRMIGTPIEEVVGAGFSKLYPETARSASREGGISAKAEVAAIHDFFTKGMKDAWDNFRMRRSELEQVGNPKQSSLPRKLSDFFGMLHGALKAPVKRAEFARSMVKRYEAATAKGEDVSNPEVRGRIMAEAFKDADRAILMQDNRVATITKMAIRNLEAPPKGQTHSTFTGKVWSTVANILLPIVKIPTNYVAETFAHTPLGLLSGHAEMISAWRRVAKGMEKSIPPEQADLILRHLKKGLIGSALMLVGYLNPNAVGGYYQHGQKRSKEDVKAGGLRIFGVDIPRLLVHNPALEALQLGSTIRRIKDSKRKKSSTETRGLTEGIVGGVAGLTEEVPLVGSALKTSKLFDSHERASFVGELVKSGVEPQFVQWLARTMDKDAQGEPVNRKSESIVDYLKSGVPGLRETLPAKK